MKFLFAITLFTFLALSTVMAKALDYDHGTSHVLISHKHGHKFQYDIKHGKHGHAYGSSHPHGYGGFGDSHH